MAQLTAQTTAEHVVGCIDAAVSRGAPIDKAAAAAFLDISETQAEAALTLAVELSMLAPSGLSYIVNSPLCRYLTTSTLDVKAAILRVVIESYEPFKLFRTRLESTLDLAVAARQTKSQLSLGATRDEIKDTLVSLGTFSQALVPAGGGQYQSGPALLPNAFAAIAVEADSLVSALQRIKVQVGPYAAALASETAVLTPLANALIRAKNNDARGAVVEAGNAVESHMDGLAVGTTVSLTGATGLGAKLDRFANANQLPKKVVAVGKYLSNIRNASDHGTDPEINKPWDILQNTGLEYVFVACTFIRITRAHFNSVEGVI